MELKQTSRNLLEQLCLLEIQQPTVKYEASVFLKDFYGENSARSVTDTFNPLQQRVACLLMHGCYTCTSHMVYTDFPVRTARNRAGAETAMLPGVHPDRRERRGPAERESQPGEIIPRWKHGTFCVQDGTLEPNLRGPERDRRRGRTLPVQEDFCGVQTLAEARKAELISGQRGPRDDRDHVWDSRGHRGNEGQQGGQHRTQCRASIKHPHWEGGLDARSPHWP